MGALANGILKNPCDSFKLTPLIFPKDVFTYRKKKFFKLYFANSKKLLKLFQQIWE